MGPKITVDSAGLMNKGLEVIEAHYLFGIEAARLDIIVHAQSVVLVLSPSPMARSPPGLRRQT